MPRIGTPLSPTATRVLLCGSGELGKEVVIELQRLGCEVIAVDRYANAPAMQVAHRSHVLSMLDGAALRAVIEAEQPHYIVRGDLGVSYRRSSLQFNIRPRRSLAGQSVATAEASTSNRQSVHACGALGARRKGT